MIRLALLLLALTAPVGAETARVISGEHGDFTRIVVELPGPADWTVGRTAMGYAFATGETGQPTYDLSRVWTRISQDRLQALRADPDSGALQLTLACSCHVFPFEYRPGMIVLDIKDGPAPEGSAFERPFNLAYPTRTMPELRMLPPVLGPESYAWLDAAPGLPLRHESVPSLPVGPVSLGPLRDELLEQISRGAAKGVVDMALPGKLLKLPEGDQGVLSWAQIRIGEMPGVSAGTDDEPIGPEACMPDESLAVAGWGEGRPPLDLLAEARGGLYGEFDTVDPKALLRTVRLHLYLGFGAEAEQYAALLLATAPAEGAPELSAYASMARLIDGGSDPDTPFAGMLACDGAAALWAALARSRLPVGREVNADAVVRSFLALPPHLRHHLGSDLADRFQTSGNAEAARMIRNAMERTPEVSAAEVARLDARADLEADRPAEARAHAERAVSEDGTDAESLVLLVEAHFQELSPLRPEIADALRAFAHDGAHAAEDGRMTQIVALALALSGRTDEAFALGAEGITSDLWQVAAALAADDAFLRQAVIPLAGPAPKTPDEVAVQVATRLVGLGFAEAALGWLGPVTPSDPEEMRRLAATAEFARGNARAAVQLLQDLDTAEDAAMRARALVQLGDLPSARQAYDAAAQPEEATRLLAWENDWAGLEADGSGPWAAAAAATAPPPAPDAGPLGRGAAALAESAEARLRLEALLAAIPKPAS